MAFGIDGIIFLCAILFNNTLQPWATGGRLQLTHKCQEADIVYRLIQ
jgi:hypothetical protein